MSAIENWYNMSQQERKEYNEARKTKINEMIETLKKNKEEYKQEQKDKEEKLKQTKKDNSIKQNRTSFNCDIVLRKDFRISPKSKKYFSGNQDIFLNQDGEPIKENYEKDSLIIPSRVMYQKKKIILTDPKFNLEQAKYMLQQVEANLGPKNSSIFKQPVEYQNSQDQFQTIQHRESFLPQIHQSPQTKSQNIRQVDRSAPFQRQNPYLNDNREQQYSSVFQPSRQNQGQYYSPQDRGQNFTDQGSRQQRDFNRNNYNQRNDFAMRNNDININNNRFNNGGSNFISAPNINNQNIIRNNYQRGDGSQPNYYYNRNFIQPQQQVYHNQMSNASQPVMKNHYSSQPYQCQQNQFFDY